MKFDIKYNGCDFIVEAESVVHAVIGIIDTGFNVSDYMEFQVLEHKTGDSSVSCPPSSNPLNSRKTSTAICLP